MSVTKEEMLNALGNPVIESFDKEGITPNYLAKKLRSEINAKETKVFKGKILKRDPNTNEIIEVEEIIYSKPLKAHDIVIKALDMAHKLRGDYPAEKRELSGIGGEAIKLIVEYDGDGNGAKGSTSETP